MKYAWAAAAGLLFAAAAADAKEYTIGEPVLAKITLPDDWKHSAIKGGGAQVTSNDNLLYIAVEPARLDKLQEAMNEALHFVAKQDVRFNLAMPDIEEKKEKGFTVRRVAYGGPDKKGLHNLVIVIGYSFENLGALVITVWNSGEGIKKHDAAIQEILGSLTDP